MSWIFSRALVEQCGSLPSSQAPEVESSEESSSDGGQYAQLNVMPTQHKFWRNDKTMDFSDLSQFGLMLQVLSPGPGEELLMSYLAGFHARTSAPQAREPELTEPEVGFGRKWYGSFAAYSPNTSSWKTVQCSLVEDLDAFSETWPRWGSMRNGVSYLRATLVPATSGKESGLLPTPTATDFKSESMSMDLIQKRQAESKRGVRLTEYLQRRMIPTPMAGNTHWGGRLDELGGSTNPFRGTEVGKLKLNPHWTEQLMGWPTGWTDLKPLETAKFQEWQQQHSLSLPADLSKAA